MNIPYSCSWFLILSHGWVTHFLYEFSPFTLGGLVCGLSWRMLVCCGKCPFCWQQPAAGAPAGPGLAVVPILYLVILGRSWRLTFVCVSSSCWIVQIFANCHFIKKNDFVSWGICHKFKFGITHSLCTIEFSVCLFEKAVLGSLKSWSVFPCLLIVLKLSKMSSQGDKFCNSCCSSPSQSRRRMWGKALRFSKGSPENFPGSENCPGRSRCGVPEFALAAAVRGTRVGNLAESPPLGSNLAVTDIWD